MQTWLWATVDRIESGENGQELAVLVFDEGPELVVPRSLLPGCGAVWWYASRSSGTRQLSARVGLKSRSDSKSSLGEKRRDEDPLAHRDEHAFRGCLPAIQPSDADRHTDGCSDRDTVAGTADRHPNAAATVPSCTDANGCARSTGDAWQRYNVRRPTRRHPL